MSSVQGRERVGETIPEHMPSSHRRFADWTIERISRDAAAVGPCAALLCEKILEEPPHPEQGFRACFGIMRLVRGFGRERVETACDRALDIGARTYGSVRSTLDNRLDQMPAPRPRRPCRGRPRRPSSRNQHR